MDPSYVRLLETGRLSRLAGELHEMLEECRLCPHECGVNRLMGETGFCRTGSDALVASYGPHYGEEEVLVGRGGSGTVFLGRCNLRCIYCQNYDISHGQDSRPMKPHELAKVMLALEAGGAHNVNFVTPTHAVPQIVKALALAAKEGFRLPLVYNSGGYDKEETLRLLDGVFDIYMPDFKYWDPGVAQELSGISDYPEAARRALREMHRQVGDLEVKEGLAMRGLLVRHLVLPGNLAGTGDILEYLAREISPGTFVNVMDQYRPAYRAMGRPPLDRRPTLGEIRQAKEAARRAGLRGPYSEDTS